MKHAILFLGLIGGFAANAQLTIDDTLYTGDAIAYYTLDSNAADLAAITGAGVTWDYSLIAGYNGITPNSDDVVDAASTSYSTDFPTTNYCEQLTGGVWTFFSNDDATDRVMVDGFVYDDGTTTFTVAYNVDNLIALQYPVNLSDTWTDPIEGTATIPAVGSVDVVGQAIITCDGTGTLKIGTNTYPNVIRVHVDEESEGTFFGQTIIMTRESFVYYDLDATNPMPIFRHDAVYADLDAGGIYGFSAVYSKDQVTNFVGMENSTEVAFNVYPSPATDVITVETGAENAEVSILNAAGQIVRNITATSPKEVVDISSLDPGIYVVKVKVGTSVGSKSITIK
jgi:hypothetical protein